MLRFASLIEFLTTSCTESLGSLSDLATCVTSTRNSANVPKSFRVCGKRYEQSLHVNIIAGADPDSYLTAAEIIDS